MCPSSLTCFLELSQAPPALAWKMARQTPEMVTPISRPPSMSAEMRPTTTGHDDRHEAGGDHLLDGRGGGDVDALGVLGLAVGGVDDLLLLRRSARAPRSRPSAAASRAGRSSGMSRNWRRTSWIMSWAALPTATMAMAEKRKGSMQPMSRPTRTYGVGGVDVDVAAPSW